MPINILLTHSMVNQSYHGKYNLFKMTHKTNTYMSLELRLSMIYFLLIDTHHVYAIDGDIPRAPSSYSVLSQSYNYNILNFDIFTMCSNEKQNMIMQSMILFENNILDFLAILAQMKKPIDALKNVINIIQSSPHEIPAFLDIPFSDALTQARQLNQTSSEPTALTFDRIQNDLASFDNIENRVTTLKQGLLAKHYPLSQVIDDLDMIIHLNMRYIHLLIQLHHLKGITPQTHTEILTFIEWLNRFALKLDANKRVLIDLYKNPSVDALSNPVCRTDNLWHLAINPYQK